MVRISLEGNICSGKTFYLKLLEKEGIVSHCYETHDIYHEYLQYEVKNTEIHLFENSPYTLKKIHGQSPESNWTPDIIIYLCCNPIVCRERYMKKNSNEISLEFVKQLHVKCEFVCDEINCPIVMYKINSQDNPENVLKCILDIIKHIPCVPCVSCV